MTNYYVYINCSKCNLRDVNSALCKYTGKENDSNFCIYKVLWRELILELTYN